MRRVVSDAIVEQEVPCGVKASCGEEDKGSFRCVEE